MQSRRFNKSTAVTSNKSSTKMSQVYHAAILMLKTCAAPKPPTPDPKEIAPVRWRREYP